MGGMALGELNMNGKSIIDCMFTFDLTITNMCFRKIKKHLIIYKSGISCSQIKKNLTMKSNKNTCLHYKVLPRESLTIQHRLLATNVWLRGERR